MKRLSPAVAALVIFGAACIGDSLRPLSDRAFCDAYRTLSDLADPYGRSPEDTERVMTANLDAVNEAYRLAPAEMRDLMSATVGIARGSFAFWEDAGFDATVVDEEAIAAFGESVLDDFQFQREAVRAEVWVQQHCPPER